MANKQSYYKFYNKNAATIIYLSKLFIRYPLNEKIPTFEQLTKDTKVARGTVQNSLYYLIKENAIKLKSRGYLGTYLLEKDIKRLVELANINYLMGCMTLPNSLLTKGLASGLKATLDNIYNIPINMAYMPDGAQRIDLLSKGRFDFTVVSKQCYLAAKNKDYNIESIIQFDDNSYSPSYSHVYNSNIKNIANARRIGIASNNSQQSLWVKDAYKDKDVEFIDVNYKDLIKALDDNIIDGTIVDCEEYSLNKDKYNIIDVKENNLLNSAVLVIDKSREELVDLLKEIINTSLVSQIQQDVNAGSLIPNY